MWLADVVRGLFGAPRHLDTTDVDLAPRQPAVEAMAVPEFRTHIRRLMLSRMTPGDVLPDPMNLFPGTVEEALMLPPELKRELYVEYQGVHGANLAHVRDEKLRESVL